MDCQALLPWLRRQARLADATYRAIAMRSRPSRARVVCSAAQASAWPLVIAPAARAVAAKLRIMGSIVASGRGVDLEFSAGEARGQQRCQELAGRERAW